jgi:hypothetical protein
LILTLSPSRLQAGWFLKPLLMKQILSAILLFLVMGANAQTDSSAQKPKFKLGLNYNSRLNYYGRTDSLQSSGFFPLAELWLSKDVYINAAPVFVNNSIQAFEYAGSVASIGYLHVGRKWISNIYMLKPFYRENARLVQSALKAQVASSFSFQNKVVNLTAGGDIKLSDDLDFGATAGLDHSIRRELKNGNVVVLDPSFFAYAGTQNFTSTYYKKKTGFLLLPGTAEQVTEEVERFNILAFEVSMPVVYAMNKWLLIVTPAYVMPQNLVEIQGRPDLSEKGNKLFYVTASLKYTF